MENTNRSSRCKRRNSRTKRGSTPSRTKDQLLAAAAQPFIEGLSTCSVGVFQASGQTSRPRSTVTMLTTNTRRLRHKSRRLGGSEKLAERARLGRLPIPLILPSRYRICIKPNMADFKFEGSVLMEFGCLGCPESLTDVLSQTSITTLVLNSLDLNIDKVVWADETTMKQYKATDVTVQPQAEQLTIAFDPPVPVPGVLIINYSGKIGENFVGFYRSKYVNAEGAEKYRGVTKFEPTFARKCFPCWDEPAYKAKFDLSIILPKHFVALSNQPIQAILPHRTNRSLHVIEFETTPVISSYLVAFVIGDFECTDGHVGSTPDYIQVKAHVPFGQAKGGRLAVNWAESFLEFYQSYFNAPLGMRKLDLVGLTCQDPSAVENWGLVIFSEAQLLQQREADLEEANEIGLIVSHKVAQHWVGNLVTMNWWSGLWLKEGLAAFLSYLSLDYIQPTRNIWHDFVGNVFVKALEADMVASAHPLVADVHHPNEIEQIFDVISQSKSAAIMRMIQTFVGERTFQLGLQVYVKRFSNGNASSNDFFRVMEETSEKPIKTVFEGWIKQSGYPLLKVESSSHFERNGTCRVVVVRQEPFCQDNVTPVKGGKGKRLWVIPLQLSLSEAPSRPVKEYLMDRPVQKFRIKDTTPNDWFLLNPGFTGFYRVKYPPEIMSELIQGIRSKRLAPQDRLGLLNELHALARAGISSTTELLTMLEALFDEDHFLVWKEINGVIGSIDVLLQNTESYSKFLSFQLNLFKKIYVRLGFTPVPGESSADAKLRLLVLRRLVQLRHPDCSDQGFKSFHKWLAREKVELRGIGFQAGILDSENSDEVLRTLVRRFRDSKYSQEKADIIESLGYAESEEIILSILDFALSNVVTPSETLVVMDTLMQNAAAKVIAWEYFVDNVSLFQKRYSAGSDDRIRLWFVEVVTKYLGKEVRVAEVRRLFARHLFVGTDKVVQQSMDKMKVYTAWRKRDELRLTEYLTHYEE